MCGLAGVLGTDWSQQQLLACRDSMAARGPDSAGLHEALLPSGLRLGMAHRRLSILDVSTAGKQPMVDPSTGNCIVFNGEIYNHLELRRLMPNEPFLSSSDTETLLIAYRHYGLAMIDRLIGMFAFALWDEDRQELYLVRDRLGIKPLYYSTQGGNFIFASQIRALLAGQFVKREVDPVGLESYLAFGAVQEPHTILNGVKPLSPGHIVRVSSEGRVTGERCYWSLGNVFRSPEPSSTEDIRNMVKTAVSDRQISDVPLGAFLSGGIDSSVVVAAMADCSSDVPRTFCLDFNEGAYREGAYAELVASRHRTNHSTVLVEPADLLKRLDDAMAAMDQPTVDGINSFFVSAVAREAGVTVALSGQGGDEIFAGYPSFRFLPKAGRLSRLPTWSILLAGWASAPFKGHRPRLDKIVDMLLSGRVDLYEAYAHQRGIFWDRVRRKLVPDSQTGARSCDWIMNGVSRDDLSPDRINAVSQLELSCYLRNTLLRDLDAFSMAHSLEVRVPLLDHRLVEHVARIPGAAKIMRGVNKALLVKSFESELPRDVVARRKGIFWFPWAEWLRGPLAQRIEESLTGTQCFALAEHGICVKASSDLLRRFAARDASVVWQQIWSLYALSDWLKRNI